MHLQILEFRCEDIRLYPFHHDQRWTTYVLKKQQQQHSNTCLLVCISLCVCVCVREREKEREGKPESLFACDDHSCYVTFILIILCADLKVLPKLFIRILF